jgi:hypothetical protein
MGRGAAAGHLGDPVLLTPRRHPPAETAPALRPARIVVLGGPAAVSDAVLAQAQQYLGPEGQHDRGGGPARPFRARGYDCQPVRVPESQSAMAVAQGPLVRAMPRAALPAPDG